jgi:hypothetical protein
MSILDNLGSKPSEAKAKGTKAKHSGTVDLKGFEVPWELTQDKKADKPHNKGGWVLTLTFATQSGGAYRHRCYLSTATVIERALAEIRKRNL